MTAQVPRLPFALDPLIAEAKRRMRRRRVLVVALLLLFGTITGAAVIATGSAGGPRSAGPPGSQQVQHPAASLSQFQVPIDATERQWRTWVLSHGYGITVGPRANLSRLRRDIRSAVEASGAMLVRLKLWEANTRRPPVEVVVATAANPAIYLRRHLMPLLDVIDHGYLFVKVVDRRGSMIFERSTLTTSNGSPEGTVGVPRDLQGCSPVIASWIDNPPPCPVR
jgi:hypothetical protein